MTGSTQKTWAARKSRRVLNWSTSERQVAPVIHKQALSALLFLHTKVFSTTRHWLLEICHPPINRLLLDVLSRRSRSVFTLGSKSPFRARTLPCVSGSTSPPQLHPLCDVPGRDKPPILPPAPTPAPMPPQCASPMPPLLPACQQSPPPRRRRRLRGRGR